LPKIALVVFQTAARKIDLALRDTNLPLSADTLDKRHERMISLSRVDNNCR